MLKKQCPCCGAPQTFFSLKGQRRMFPCERKENHVCMHCAVCNNQIGKPIHTIISHILAIGLLVVSWWIARVLRDFLGLWSDYKDIFFDAPIMFLVYIVISSIVWYFTPLNCTKTEYVNRLENIDPIHIEKNPSLTTIEQKLVKLGVGFATFVQVFLLITIALGIIYIWVK
jgi:hypothetical protein